MISRPGDTVNNIQHTQEMSNFRDMPTMLTLQNLAAEAKKPPEPPFPGLELLALGEGMASVSTPLAIQNAP